MSIVETSGKDTVRFVTAEDHAIPSKIVLPKPKPKLELVLPNGDINWHCPCLGNNIVGPCGPEYRDYYSCMINSNDETRSECLESLSIVQKCKSQYPTLFPKLPQDED